jgi:hypothetical protein
MLDDGDLATEQVLKIDAPSHDDESRKNSCSDLQGALVEIHAMDEMLDNCEMALNHGFDDATTNTICSHLGTIDDERIDNFPTQGFTNSSGVKDVVDLSFPGNGSIGTQPISSRWGGSLIQRNKSLASVGGMHPVLTVEEEERIEQLLHEDEEDDEKYAFVSSTEEDREIEIDKLLLCLGFDFQGNGKNEARDDMRGDKVIRELAKQRQERVHEQRIDQALRVLLHEPLPSVIRSPEEDFSERDNENNSPSICDETIATAPLTEEDIQLLIQTASISESSLPLADRESIRKLASSIMIEEASKVATKESSEP